MQGPADSGAREVYFLEISAFCGNLIVQWVDLGTALEDVAEVLSTIARQATLGASKWVKGFIPRQPVLDVLERKVNGRLQLAHRVSPWPVLFGTGYQFAVHGGVTIFSYGFLTYLFSFRLRLGVCGGTRPTRSGARDPVERDKRGGLKR